MLEVAEHYYGFGGVSPINEQNRQLIAAIKSDLDTHEIQLPIYWGNRNWHPMLPDTLREMAGDGVKRALAFFTSGFSCYSGCRQYRENIADARAEVGPDAPQVEKTRMFFNHPGYIETMVERTRAAIDDLPGGDPSTVPLVFTAHSIPLSMAENCRYERQLNESSRLVAEGVGNANWSLVYQSRSGPPHQPWLEPDVCDFLRERHSEDGWRQAVIVPIGFISDHVEVIYDLDTEAQQVCDELGIDMRRAATAGTHPRFVSMIRELVVERMAGSSDRPAVGRLGPSHDVCPEDCCLYTPTRPARPPAAR